MSKVLVDFEVKQQQLIQELERQKRAFMDLADQEEKAEKTASSNAQKRKQRLKEETQDLKELKKRRDKAFDPKEIAEYNARIKETETRVKNLQGNYGNLEKSNNRLGKSFQVIGTYIAGAFAVDRLVRFGQEAIELAGKAEGVRQAFDRLNSPTLLNDLRKATRGTVSDLELMQAAVRAKNFKVPLEQLATYFEFATKRAAQTGESVDYLVNSIIDGIGRKSSLVLDNLGISATELQKEMKETGDFGAAAGNIIQRELEKAGDVIETTAQKTARLRAENENLKVSVGQSLIPIYNEFLEALNLVFKGMQSIETIMDRVADNRLSEAAKEDRKEVEALAAAYLKNGAAINETDAKVKAAKSLINQYKEALKSASNEQKEGISDQITALSELINTITTVNAVSEDQKDLTEEQTEALIKQAEAMWELRKATMAVQAEIEKELSKFDFSESQAPDDSGALSFFGIGLDNFEEEQGEMIEGFDETTRKMKELGISNMSDYFKYLKEEKEKTAKEIRDFTAQFAADISSILIDIQSNSIDAQLQEQQRQYEEEERMQLEHLNTERSRELSNKRLTDNQKTQLEKQYEERNLKIKEEAERKKSKAEADAAQKKKTLAIIEATINTAVAVTSAYPNIVLAAAIALLGGLEIAAIASQKIPEYATGTAYLQPWAPGQGSRKDDIPVMANKGEAIIPTVRNMEAPGLAQAWMDGKLEDYIFKRYSMPKIKEALHSIELQKEKDFASNVAGAMILNFNDKNLIKEIRRGNKALTEYLPEIARNNHKNPARS